MSFLDELAAVLPPDLPARSQCIELAAMHLDLIEEANQHFNLTRIVGPRDAAIKHVVDSVLPWRCFADAAHIVDAGTGAGFPGIPLAAVLPAVRFTLAESIGKKARFVAEAVRALELKNVTVANARAEDVLRSAARVTITGRAVAPLHKSVDLFGAAIASGSRALLYKGSQTDAEIEEAAPALRRRSLAARVALRYELPDGLGTRSIVEVARSTLLK